MVHVLLLTSSIGAVTALPNNALRIDRLRLNQLDPALVSPNTTMGTTYLPPWLKLEEAVAKPFHVYDESFLKLIGDNPTLSVIATSPRDPIFHEAVVWLRGTDEMFVAQNAGSPDAETGLNKSNIIQKISLRAAQAIADGTNTSSEVEVVTVSPEPNVINSNGAANFRGQFVYAVEGQGADIASTLYLMNPYEPYNSTVLVSSFYGRQFNSLNDVAVNPRNGEIYFTDSLYGYLQGYRPVSEIQTQIYRLNADTGALSVVADGIKKPNGITFSPDGSYAYVTDTGAQNANFGTNSSDPASIYQYVVDDDGGWSNRRTFAHATTGIPDGVHCDKAGNVWAGVGDGVAVWNRKGELIGKLFLNHWVANFRWASGGRMVITAQTKLYYATIAAEGSDPEDQY